ncbi:MAG: hypothetical protein ACI9L9_001016, partial [Marivirga sp.]
NAFLKSVTGSFYCFLCVFNEHLVLSIVLLSKFDLTVYSKKKSAISIIARKNML